MLDETFESIIRQKLESLRLSVSPADWADLLNRMHAAFDDLIREKLLALELPAQAGDWEAMLERMDQAVEQAIRQKLAQLHLDSESGDWGHMQGHLDENPFDVAVSTKLGAKSLEETESDWADFAAQLDESPVDTAFAQSLAGLELAFQPSDWDRMLDTMENTFDQAIRQALHDFELPYDAHTWPGLAQQLDERPFDSQIRSKLNDATLAERETDWTLMLSALEAPFDQEVKGKFDAYALPLQAEDWRLMAHQLDAEVIPGERTPVALWYRNWRNYSAAAAAVLMLLFTMTGGRDTIRFRSNPAQLVGLENNSPVILPQLTTSPLQNPMLVVNPELKEVAEQLILGQTENPDLATATSGPTSETENGSAVAAVTEIQPIDARVPQSGQIAATRLLQSSRANSLLSGEGKIPHNEDPGSIAVLYEEMDLSDIHRVGPIAFGDVWKGDQLRSNQAPESDFTLLEWRPAFRVGMYGANARTWAELTGDSPISGYTYGARIEMELTEQLSVISGLNYSEKRFRHTFPVQVEPRRYIQNELEGQLFLIEAPLMLRYDLTKKPDAVVNFYLQAGVVAQISTQENYWHYDPSTSTNRSYENVSQLRVVSPEKLERGYNTYIGNLQATMGLEYAITPRLSAQLEPYLLLGLQPTKGAGTAGLNKRLSTVGVGFGVVYDLKKE